MYYRDDCTMIMSLWLNLRKSLQKPTSSLITKRLFHEPESNNKISESGDKSSNGKGTDEREQIFSFPYGTKECIVYREKGNQTVIKQSKQSRNQLCEIAKNQWRN